MAAMAAIRQLSATEVNGMSQPHLARNRVLLALPDDLASRIEPHQERVHLALGTVLQNPGEPIEHIHFPLDCLISHILTMQDGKTAEVAMTSHEDFAGVEALLGGDTVAGTRYVVRMPGECIRIAKDVLLRELENDSRFRAAMLQGLRKFLSQASQNAACNALHSLEQRLARWLLECRTRVRRSEIRTTQQFLSEMLGVRRAGVSAALGKFAERGLVKHRRGVTTLVDLEALEALSCECYSVLFEESELILAAAATDAA